MNSVWLDIPVVAGKVRSDGERAIVIKAYHVPPDQRNEALFFLKPELCADSDVRLDEISRYLAEVFEKYNLEVVAGSAFGGAFLERQNIMARHYGTINRVSKVGLAALSPDAQAVLQSKFQEDLSKRAKVLGGHEALTHFPFLTEEGLSVLWDTKNSESVRIVPGVYALAFQILSERVVLLNGFHPYQLKFFTGQGRCIVCFIVRSAASWSALRARVIGATNPKEAEPGSIRRTMLERKDDWSINEVNKGLNGVHLSAGPVEAYFEIERFFGSGSNENSILMSDTNFGALARDLGISESKLSNCRENPIISVNGKQTPLFDASEDMELVDGGRFLAELPI